MDVLGQGLLDRFIAVRRLGHDLEVRLGVEHGLEASEDDRVIVRDEDPGLQRSGHGPAVHPSTHRRAARRDAECVAWIRRRTPHRSRRGAGLSRRVCWRRPRPIPRPPPQLPSALASVGEALDALTLAFERAPHSLVPSGDPHEPICRRFERAAAGWPATYGCEGPSYERQAQLLSSLYEAGATLRLSRRACARANDLLIDLTASGEPAAHHASLAGLSTRSHGPPTTSSTTMERTSSKRRWRSAASQDRPKPGVRCRQPSGASSRRSRSSFWPRRRWNGPQRRSRRARQVPGSAVPIGSSSGCTMASRILQEALFDAHMAAAAARSLASRALGRSVATPMMAGGKEPRGTRAKKS